MGDKKKKVAIPYWEQIMWWCSIIGGLFVMVSAFPMIPWRYSRVDTNMGNRFVMERYYNVLGCTNNMGKYEQWFTLKRKIQRKSEEFGKPSPMSALAGTVTGSLGVGGAAAGCMNWQQCKDHTAQRYINYATLAYCSIFNLAFIVIGAICAIASVVFLGFEQAEYGKAEKKKKKKKGEGLCDFSPATKTMNLAIVGFLLPFVGVSAYVFMTGKALNNLKESAYYPYAGAYVGAFVAGFGVFLLWIGMMIAIHRVWPYSKKLCGKGGEEEEGEEGEALAGAQQYGEGAGMGYAGGYDASAGQQQWGQQQWGQQQYGQGQEQPSW